MWFRATYRTPRCDGLRSLWELNLNLDVQQIAMLAKPFTVLQLARMLRPGVGLRF